MRRIKIGNKVLGEKKPPEPEPLPPPFSEYDSYFEIMKDGSIQAYIKNMDHYDVYNPFSGTKFEFLHFGDKK